MKNARNILQNIKFSNTIIGIQGLALHSNHSTLNSVLPEMDFDGFFVQPSGLSSKGAAQRAVPNTFVRP